MGEEYTVVHILSVAGRQWLALGKLEASCPIGLPLRPQEAGASDSFIEEAMRELVQMGDEENLDALLQQRLGYLSCDLRAFPFIRRGKRLVEQQHGVWPQAIHDYAHSAELLIELSACHRRVLFALEMREQPLADIGAEGFGGHEHPALHHQLRQAHRRRDRR